VGGGGVGVGVGLATFTVIAIERLRSDPSLLRIAADSVWLPFDNLVVSSCAVQGAPCTDATGWSSTKKSTWTAGLIGSTASDTVPAIRAPSPGLSQLMGSAETVPGRNGVKASATRSAKAATRRRADRRCTCVYLAPKTTRRIRPR
jgi:hypothetical protein